MQRILEKVEVSKTKKTSIVWENNLFITIVNYKTSLNNNGELQNL